MWGDISIAFLLAFITSYVITPYTIRLARKIGALDIPKSDRKIHEKAMPRLGGLAVIAGFTVSISYLLIAMNLEGTINSIGIDNYFHKLIGLFASVLILGTFCFFDDLKGIPAYVKLIGQILAAAVAIFNGIQIDKIEISFFNIYI